MTNISQELMEELFKIEKIITDTKEMYLFFSNSTEEEIIKLCWNDHIMSEEAYMKLFEMACYTNKPKVVQNFLTKEYTTNSKQMSVDLDFLFLTDAINKAIIAENFNIIDIIFNHLKLRMEHPISKINSYNKKTYFYIFSIFKKFLVNDDLFLLNNQTFFYNQIKFKEKITLINKSITENSPKTFKFLINDMKNSQDFKSNFHLFFESTFTEKKKAFFDIFIKETNFNCKDNFSYFIKSLFALKFSNDNNFKYNYILEHANVNELFTFDIFIDNLKEIKFQNIDVICKFICLPKVIQHIDLKWIEENFDHPEDLKAIKKIINISNF